MTHLPELIAAYTGMTPWARGLLLDTARQYLICWPVLRVDGPSLNLVPKDVIVQPGPDVFNRNRNRLPLVLVREAKD
jgi:hypothetical protein